MQHEQDFLQYLPVVQLLGSRMGAAVLGVRQQRLEPALSSSEGLGRAITYLLTRGRLLKGRDCPESGMSLNPPPGNAVRQDFSKTIEVPKHVWI